MLFNSYIYIFAFLPIVFGLFHYSNKSGKSPLNILIIASLLFYSWWRVEYLPLIVISILFNYYIGKVLNGSNIKRIRIPKKYVLYVGVATNLTLLGYYKYTDFIINNMNMLFVTNIEMKHFILPLAISFFTFQQIAFLVDSYRSDVSNYSLANYTLFVTFFPQLIAGPIVHHKEMMPQLLDKGNWRINQFNISKGIYIFSIGLFKKVILADSFAKLANIGYDYAAVLTFVEAWVTTLSYSFQLYFDFSGYTDMAFGAALLFNIHLPQNFNSPYKALTIQDFWRRWHITLSRFLRDYVYVPFGGSRKGELTTHRNLFITFILGGLWHGAGWMFIIWGFLHALGLSFHRLWGATNIKLNKIISIFITFNFINVTWVFFRAKSLDDALKIFKGLIGYSGVTLPMIFKSILPDSFRPLFQYGGTLENIYGDIQSILLIIIGFIVVLMLPNSYKLALDYKYSRGTTIYTIVILTISLLTLNNVKEFLYFNF